MSAARTEGQHAASRAWHKRNRITARERGVCPRCGLPAWNGGRQCEAHTLSDRARQLVSAKRQREADAQRAEAVAVEVVSISAPIIPVRSSWLVVPGARPVRL